MTIPITEMVGVATVMSEHLNGVPWRDYVIRALTDVGYKIDTSNNHILFEDRVLGGMGFQEVSEAADAIQELALPLAERPWVGRPVGVLRFELFDQDDLAALIVHHCRGDVGRIDLGRTYASTGIQTFGLENIVSKYGFNDGDALLYRDREDYLDYVSAQVNTALVQSGFEDGAGVTPTGHNPIRIAEIRRDGRLVEDDVDALSSYSVSFAAFRFPFPKRDFWRV